MGWVKSQVMGPMTGMSRQRVLRPQNSTDQQSSSSSAPSGDILEDALPFDVAGQIPQIHALHYSIEKNSLPLAK